MSAPAVAITLGLTALPVLALYWAFAPRDHGTGSGERTALAGIALGMGPGLTSCSWFAWHCLVGAPGWVYLATETFLLIVAAWAIRRWIRSSAANQFPLTPPVPAGRSPGIWPTAALVLLAVGCTLAVACAVAREPNGTDDALAMWNLHARVLHRGGLNGEWAGFFATGKKCGCHADYPLLLPASIARLWGAAGDEPNLASPLLSVLFAVATVVTGIGITTQLRGRTQGLLIGLTLLGTSLFVKHAGMQYADLAMGWGMLATSGSLLLYEQTRRSAPKWLLLAGLAAGLTAWTKNEGLAFAVLCGGCCAVRWVWQSNRLSRLGEPLTLFVGMLAPMAIVVWFKVRYAPGSEFAAPWPVLLSRMGDLSRYGIIVGGMGTTLLQTGKFTLAAVAGYAWLMGRGEPRRGLGLSAVLIAGMLGGIGLCYLITPYPLEWHVYSSMGRLWLQLWPSLLVLGFAWTAAPEERLALVLGAPQAIHGPHFSVQSDLLETAPRHSWSR